MHQESIEYQVGGIISKGEVFYEESSQQKKPGVIVAHAWKGQDSFAKEKAQELAKLGYVALAADVYGGGKHVETKEEAQGLMLPLFKNRKLLRERILAAYQALRNLKNVDGSKIGAIGFCFGGLTVLELLRSGVDLKGIVSFHGVLANSLGETKAELEPAASKLHGSALILHGNDDPLVPLNDLLALQKELTQAHVDWEMDIYGHTKHAFTNPDANDHAAGLVYNQKVCHRAFISMKLFFEDVFK